MAQQTSIRIHGLSKLLKRLDGITRKDVIYRSFWQSSAMLISWVKKYRLTGPRPKYLGVVTGRLRSSISMGRVIKRGNIFVQAIGTNVKYAPFHEFGTKHLPARPFLAPALQSRENHKRIIRIFGKEIQARLNKG